MRRRQVFAENTRRLEAARKAMYEPPKPNAFVPAHDDSTRCTVCDREFSSVHGLMVHTSRMHKK